MAKCQYNGDSPSQSPSHIPDRAGLSGGIGIFLVEPAPFRAMAAIKMSDMSATYIVDDSTAMYVGENVDHVRRLRYHVPAEATRPNRALPTPTSID